jgi:hypothetical protein
MGQDVGKIDMLIVIILKSNAFKANTMHQEIILIHALTMSIFGPILQKIKSQRD